MTEPPIELFKAIAHPLRFAILTALAEAELNVGQIESVTGIGQPTLSQQLSILRKAGLAQARREAKLVYYSLGSANIAHAIGSLEKLTSRTAALPARAGETDTSLSGAAAFARLD